MKPLETQPGRCVHLSSIVSAVHFSDLSIIVLLRCLLFHMDRRKPQGQTTSRPRRASLSNLARGFYRQGNPLFYSFWFVSPRFLAYFYLDFIKFSGEGHAENNELSYDFNSKLLHMAWHPTANMIACAAGSSLLMYNA